MGGLGRSDKDDISQKTYICFIFFILIDFLAKIELTNQEEIDLARKFEI